MYACVCASLISSSKAKLTIIHSINQVTLCISLNKNNPLISLSLSILFLLNTTRWVHEKWIKNFPIEWRMFCMFYKPSRSSSTLKRSSRWMMRITQKYIYALFENCWCYEFPNLHFNIITTTRIWHIFQFVFWLYFSLSLSVFILFIIP